MSGTTISLLPVGAITPAPGVAGLSAPILEMQGGPIGPTAVSALGDTRLAVNDADGKLYVSENGGAYLPLATGGTSPWVSAGGIISEVTLTDTVSMGSAAAVAGRKVYILETGANRGIRVESAVPTRNVLDFLATGDANPRVNMTGTRFSIGSGVEAVANHYVWMTGPSEGAGFKLGDGTAPPDLTMSRIAGPLFNFNLGARFGGDIERFEAQWNLKTVRTNDGAGDTIQVLGADGVATVANTAWTGGEAQIQAGNAAANLAAQAAGASVRITAGNAASGVGGAAANGGGLVVATGAGAGGGVSGAVVFQDTAAGGIDVVPPADNAGSIGTAALRFNLVRAVNIVSGDMCFDDQTCRVCGQPFQEGDDLVMRVIGVEPDGDTGRRLTRTVPAHHGCR